FRIGGHFPFVEGAVPAVDDPAEQLLARTWRPALSTIGADGIPAVAVAGNVLRPQTALALSVRIPPTCDPQRAIEAIDHCLTTDPPYGAHVTFERGSAAPGWNAPPTAAWLDDALA